MTEQCDHLIDYFNHQLTEGKKQEFEQHMRACESCQEELQELRDLTDDLPFIAESMEPPEGMKERVLASVFDEKNDNKNEQEFTSTLSEENSVGQESSIPYKHRKTPVIYGSLAAALLLSIVGNGYLWNEARELESENQHITMERDIIEADYHELLAEGEDDGGVADVLLTSNLASSEDEGQSQGTATIISENGHVDLVIQVTGLPPLSGSEAFQAWIIEGETPAPAGSFHIDEDGNGAMTFRISDMEDFQIDHIAITLEPQPNNEAPQGEIVLASQM